MRTILAIGAVLLLAAPALAQTKSGSAGTSSPTTGDVSVGTTSTGASGNGAVGVSGTADARFDTQNNTARQGSTAIARDEDERARSRATTRVSPNGDVRSRSMTIYKQRGERPVITGESTVNGQSRK
ncbi:MAG: hypothetical protein JWN21_2083 [Sphingomonas bacterium]|uniref:hypothetical protein n=1 Tax=Sphingomonas bacterium TaxID=1895847 RepID=UPI00262B03EB|nr:hypothetical protein [Sphingomonas bacterium]MDB5696540.1 hypothetical protein [Sphingomonas bacterium]